MKKISKLEAIIILSSVGYLCIAILVAILTYANDIADLEQKIDILEEQIDEYEQELTDIAKSTGLLDDINLEIQIKQNELDNLNQQIEEANKELEGQ